MAARNSSGSAGSKKKKPAGKRAPTKKAVKARGGANGSKPKPAKKANGKKAKVAERKPAKKATAGKKPARKPTKKATADKKPARKTTRASASRATQSSPLRSTVSSLADAVPAPSREAREARARATLPIPSSTFFF